ncbi:MAG: PD40 domain-containing protein [Bacteroidales bacterium]|nr:PD40 domain-containing protein [Bacteroidales bacterium]
MKKIFLITSSIVLAATTLMAQETPLWLRKNAISPDGKTIAFTYKGDIYTVPVAGGTAKQITSHSAYDTDPLWTPDGKHIVFSSEREASRDIYITSSEGGVPKRITNYPGRETPKAVLPDGRILFTAALQADATYDGFPSGSQVYIVSDIDKKPELVTSLNLPELSISKNGTIIYEDYKGYEDPFRKHHTSSVTRDIWVYEGASLKGDFKIDPAIGKFTKLSDYVGEDRQPVFAADGDTFYFISERGGKTLNLFKSSLSAPTKVTQLTSYTKNPVRYISVANDGTVAFSYNGELYTIRDGGKAKKVEINVLRDEIEKDMYRMTFTGNTASMSPSPDGKEFAIVIRGDVFVTSEEFKTTKRITNTPEQERNVSFGKDGRSLYYSAERDGCWSIYRSILTDEKDKGFTYAMKFKEERFSPAGETSFQPVVSPDGKWVAYLRDRTELVIKPTAGGPVKSLLKGVNYSYSDGDQYFSWSPDSQYLLTRYIGNGGWHNADVALIDINTGALTDLTQSGYSDGNFKWALGGKAMTWESDKNGYRSHGSWGSEGDIYIMFFDAKAKADFLRDKEDIALDKLRSPEKKDKKDSTAKKEEPKVEKLKLDLDGRQYRILRLTKSSNNYGDHYLKKDGSKLYYTTPLESGFGLCVYDLREGEVKVIQRGVRGTITPSKDEKALYVTSGAGISKITLADNKVKKIPISGEYEFKPKAERTYMFEHIWKQVKEKFYDPALHGADWDYYHKNYARFLPSINNYYDFQEMLSEMLGELNGSHTGARYYPVGGESLGRLGVIYDLDWKGEGLKIKEVLPDGVLAVADAEIKAGDIITAIDGKTIGAGENWYPLLSNRAGKKTVINVRKQGGAEVELYVKPAMTESDLLYRRWVRQREEMVEKLSGGRVGYVHVKGMDSPSFREVYANALGKYRNCEALIVDTRHNGGGWLHDDLATFLAGKAYLEFKPRGQYIGTEPYNKWTKPSCVLVCEDNYSDACGFPYTYRALGLGKIIGAPVPGTMTAVWWERQINAGIVFGIPQVGSWGLDEGRYLENFQIEPDILVYNDPASVLAGEDKQLEAAVKEMLKEIGK